MSILLTDFSKLMVNKISQPKHKYRDVQGWGRSREKESEWVGGGERKREREREREGGRGEVVIL